METFIKYNGLIVHQIILAYILVTSATKKGGIRLTDESGVIASPGYPNSYPNSIAFIWLINTTQSKYVELTFHDFDVEPYKGCTADYVKIRNKKPSNGNFKDVPQIGPYCNGHKPPKVVLSSSNLMAIVFISDSSISRRGFNATYRSLDKQACAYVKQESHGTIMTPGFPLTYPREGECFWLISVENHLYVRLEFIAFELEINAQLCMDEILIRDGKTTSSPLLLRGCRLLSRIIYSTSNHLRIEFKSRGYHQKRGFKALYTTTTTKGCGGDFYAENGTLLSPNYNMEARYTYPAYSNCLWRVVAPKGHVISLKFTLFDVVAGSNGFCDEDYIQVFDGPDSRTRPIGKYCNIEKPDVITSTGNTLSMRFISNARRHGGGFYVQYRRHKTDCQSPLGMEDGRVVSYKISASSFLRESPHFRPASARLNGPYTWCSQPQINNQAVEFLQIDLGKSTLLTAVATQGYMMTGTRQSYFITKYKLMYSNNDGRFFKNYIKPSNKNSEYKPKVFRGNSNPVGIIKHNLEQPIVAQMVRIVPLGYLHGRKRTICTKVEVFGCKFNFGDGYLLQSLDGHILYKGKRSSPRSNHWIISPSTIYMNSAVYLMPLYFNIDCDKAMVKVSDGTQNHSFCGAKHLSLYQLYSGNGQLKISLVALKGNLEGQNFGFEFFTENLGTGRVLRSARGLVRGFRSYQNLPNRALNVSKSTWIIAVPLGKKIAARFTSMKLGKAANGNECDDYVEIKDGLLDSSKTFGNFCHGIPTKTVVSTKNSLRVEFHTNPHSERSRRDLASPSVLFEITYASLPINASSVSGMLLSADERTKDWPKSRGEASSINNGCHLWSTTIAALLVTMFWILLPT